MKKTLSLFFISFFFLFLYAPIFVLVTYSFNTKGFPSHWEGFTLHWYIELFRSDEIWYAFLVSFLVASFATSLSLLMGLAFIFFDFVGGRVKHALSLFYVNLVFPETVLGVSLLGYFLLFQITLGFQTLIIAHTLLALGFVIPVLYMKYRSLDHNLIEASVSLGATKIQTYFRIVIPLLFPAMISSGLMVFILSFDDFALSFFCAGTHIQTLSLHLLSMIRVGIEPTMNALSFVLLLFSSVLVMIFFSKRVRSRIF